MVRRRPVFSAVLGTVAGILILASGCVDQDPTAVQLQPAKALSAAKAYEAGTYVSIIGPEGGILNHPVGRIVFPAGALAAETAITAQVDGRRLAATFGPHGLTFPPGREPTIEFSFAGSRVIPERLQIVYLDDADGILESLLTSSNNGTASSLLRHFSKYALAEAEP